MAFFIDFRKAFDLIDPFFDLLFLKLFHYGFDNFSLKLMKNYFNMRSQSTRINKSISEPLPIRLGVPQGSILGPLLFLIFINHMPFNTDLSTILFADDTSLSASDQLLPAFFSKFSQTF